MSRLLEEAKKLIQISTIVHPGNEEIANYLLEIMKARGLKAYSQLVTHSVDEISKRQFNVVGILGDPLVDRKTRKGLLLGTHLDTATPGRLENWTQTGGRPHSPVVLDGKIYGIGSANAKLDFLCKLAAIERSRELILKMPVYLVGMAAHEYGMLGASYLLKSVALNPKCVLIGLPTDLRLVNQHKSQAVYSVSIHSQMVERDARGFNRKITLEALGRAVHGSFPGNGTNALNLMFDLLGSAQEMGFELRFMKIEGGDCHGKNPDYAKTEFYLTSHQLEDFKRFCSRISEREGGEGRYRFRFGGLGDSGVRFFPEEVFLCISELINSFGLLDRELHALTEDGFTPPCSTVNLNQIDQRPDFLRLLFDLRLLPQTDPAWIESKIQAILQTLSSGYPNLNIKMTREQYTPAFQPKKDSSLNQLCQESLQDVGLEHVPMAGSMASEAALFAKEGYEVAVFGPGNAAVCAGAPNEHVSLQQLESATRFYQKMIERVCT